MAKNDPSDAKCSTGAREEVEELVRVCRELFPERSSAAKTFQKYEFLREQFLLMLLEQIQIIGRSSGLAPAEVAIPRNDTKPITQVGNETKFVRRLLFEGRIRKDGEDKYYLRQRASTFERRMRERPESSEDIGNLCADLLLGAPSIPDSLAELQHRLATLGQSEQRSCILDAGSTTGDIAASLANRLQQSTSYLRALTIISNGPNILETLERFENPLIEVLMLPGRLRYQTASIIGPVTDKFIDGMDAQVDAAFLGGTSLHLAGHEGRMLGKFACNHEAERSTKARLLARGRLRAIAMAHTKIHIGAAAGRVATWNFASTNDVDLLITDKLKAEQKSAFESMQGVTQAKIGKAVLVWFNRTSC